VVERADDGLPGGNEIVKDGYILFGVGPGSTECPVHSPAEGGHHLVEKETA
jgi:hypothetical protein